MDKLKAALNARVERVHAIERREIGDGYTGDVDAILIPLLLENEDKTRLLLSECNQDEFEIMATVFYECALKFGLPFVEFLIEQAEEKGWTEYLEDMIGEARAEVE